MTQVANPPPPTQTAGVILWVEDLTTQTYLSECWGFDPDISIMMAGGSPNVISVVEHSLKMAATNVFGFVDRDFGSTNRPNWRSAAASRVFRSEVHEAENFLLDGRALAACPLNTANLPEGDIEARLLATATRMPWWMGCRQTLFELRREVTDGFPSHPGYHQIQDQQSAENYIKTHNWYNNIAARVGQITAAQHVTNLIAAGHAQFQPMLGTGDWRRFFSGKEIFREVRDWVFRTAGPPFGEARDAELARAVAREQTATGTIPLEVTELHAAVRLRAGL